jgi:hypothetical protein
MSVPGHAAERPGGDGDEAYRMDLSGVWSLKLGSSGERGSSEKHGGGFDDPITLPGSLAERGKGPRQAPAPQVNELSSEYPFVGTAWFRRSVTIPAAWDGLAGGLVIERSKPSRAWLGDDLLGACDALGTPQFFPIGRFRSGTSELTVSVDNEARPAEGVGGHMITTNIQTNWNGLLGKIQLVAFPQVRIAALKAVGDLAGKSVRLSVKLENRGKGQAPSTLVVHARPFNSPRASGTPPRRLEQGVSVAPGMTSSELTLPLGDDPLLWDEFDPGLYEITVELRTDQADSIPDKRVIEFGLREFTRVGSQFAINGKKVMLRGKHDAMLFPLTGYASMNLQDWMRVMQVAKEYGINHYRFHSCTPPDAAFAAADRLGLYLQPELYQFGGKYTGDPYFLEEGLRILKTYGHHPSFVMFSLGNEIGGDRAEMARHIEALRKADPTKLYAQGSNNEFWKPVLAPDDDYWTTVRTLGDSAEHAVRGSFSHADMPLGHIQRLRPSTLIDYTAAIDGVPVPVIGHETGQYQVFPRFSEIGKFTGVQKPWNLEVFRHRLKQSGMLDRADAFVAASGALAAICYREEVEACLRTPGFGGFQLLDLQDFPGQGTALVGLVDSFMDDKGLISREEWRQTCAPATLLARFESYTWTTDQRFVCRVQLPNYSPADLAAGTLRWELRNDAGSVLKSGKFASPPCPQGKLTDLGGIRVDLSDIPSPARHHLVLTLDDAGIRNRYPLWIYPAAAAATPPATDADASLIRRAWGDETKLRLANGETVLLLPDPSSLKGVEGFFTPDFWCYPMFRNICERVKKPTAPGPLGLCIDENHPALAGFPTDSHSDWQWYDLVMNSRSMILDGAPTDFRPIVEVIDNFERNHRLGCLLEARVGKGRLILCSLGLMEKPDNPVARQLLRSLERHARSDHQPRLALSPQDLDRIFDPPHRAPATAADASFSEFFNRKE